MSIYDKKETDLAFIKYLLPLIPGVFAGLILLDFYGIFTVSYFSDMDVETKMVYLAYTLAGLSVILFLYFFKISDNNKNRW